jgi:tetratricopeptide (TPR) repeat protein/transcriptional regulator with XRE-family HTH domain
MEGIWRKRGEMNKPQWLFHDLAHPTLKMNKKKLQTIDLFANLVLRLERNTACFLSRGTGNVPLSLFKFIYIFVALLGPRSVLNQGVVKMAHKQPNPLLRRARLKNYWDQSHVAELLGVTPLTVGRWERGETLPSSYCQSKLVQLFGLSLSQLGFFSIMKDDLQETETKQQSIIDPTISLPSQQLIGRDDLIAIIQQQLSENPTSIALHGIPGVGKTILVQSLISNGSQDGFLWAALGKRPNISEILSRWGTMFGIAGDGIGTKSNETWVTILREAIGTRRLLVILDDVWDYKDTIALKVGGPYCSYIATTRFPQIAASFAMPMQAAIRVPELSEENGIILLERLAPEITTYSGEKVRTLVRSVGALPLALMLAGRYLHVQGYSGQQRRLRKAMELLLDAKQRIHLSEPVTLTDPHPSLSPEMSLSLQSVIGVSDHTLNERAQSALRALSVFPAKPNTFSEEAALAVSAVPVEVLDELIDVGLLEIDGRGRYTLHQTITDYARASLVDQNPSQHFVAYFAKYVQQQTEFEEIESANVLAMLDIAHHMGRKEDLIQGTCAFVPFLLLRGLYNLAEYYLLHAYEAAQSTIENEDVPLLLLLGQTAQKQGNYPQAVEYFQQGIMLARRQDNSEWISALLADLGWVTWKQGYYIQAEEYLREGLDLARQIRNEERICKVLRVLGAVLSSLGRYSEGHEHLNEGLALARQIGNREQICVLLIDLGVSFQEMGDLFLSEKLLCEGLALARQLGHREWMSLALLNLTDIALVSQQYNDAEDYAHEGLLLAQQIDNSEWKCSHLTNLGIAAREQRNFAQAQAYILEAIPLAQQIRRPYLIFMTMYEYASLAIEQEDEHLAETLLMKSRTIIPEGDRGSMGFWMFGMARLVALQGNIPEARRLGEESKNALPAHWAKRAEQWLNKLPSKE